MHTCWIKVLMSPNFWTVPDIFLIKSEMVHFIDMFWCEKQLASGSYQLVLR